jgi:hypothetical protein
MLLSIEATLDAASSVNVFLDTAIPYVWLTGWVVLVLLLQKWRWDSKWLLLRRLIGGELAVRVVRATTGTEHCHCCKTARRFFPCWLDGPRWRTYAAHSPDSGGSPWRRGGSRAVKLTTGLAEAWFSVSVCRPDRECRSQVSVSLSIHSRLSDTKQPASGMHACMHGTQEKWWRGTGHGYGYHDH